MDEASARKLVNAFYGAAFREGTLEHHPGPSNATLKKAGDASDKARSALMLALTGGPT